MVEINSRIFAGSGLSPVRTPLCKVRRRLNTLRLRSERCRICRERFAADLVFAIFGVVGRARSWSEPTLSRPTQPHQQSGARCSAYLALLRGAAKGPQRCHAERSRSASPTCVTSSAFGRSLDFARDDIAMLRAPTARRRDQCASTALRLDSDKVSPAI
jgi:hypothetical protein